MKPEMSQRRLSGYEVSTSVNILVSSTFFAVRYRFDRSRGSGYTAVIPPHSRFPCERAVGARPYGDGGISASFII